jgi:small subunit ribosomal protein S8
LKYQDSRSVISGLKRISTPGLRKYVGSEQLPRVLGGLGIAIISTSRGLMTDRQAREAKLGGEVLCEIW